MYKKICMKCHKKWLIGYIEFWGGTKVRLTKEGIEECDVCGCIDPIPVTPGELHDAFDEVFGG